MAQVGGSALSWISPLGWASQTAPYVLDRWAPLALLLALTALCVIAAYFLQGQRDFGASLITVRPGPAHARSFLGRPLGLAMRIQRSNFLGWGMGILRSEEHTSELQSRGHLVCRLLLDKKKI